MLADVAISNYDVFHKVWDVVPDGDGALAESATGREVLQLISARFQLLAGEHKTLARLAGLDFNVDNTHCFGLSFESGRNVVGYDEKQEAVFDVNGKVHVEGSGRPRFYT